MQDRMVVISRYQACQGFQDRQSLAFRPRLLSTLLEFLVTLQLVELAQLLPSVAAKLTVVLARTGRRRTPGHSVPA